MATRKGEGMTPEEAQKHIPQEETISEGPLSLLTKAVKTNCQILINWRNNRKLLGRVISIVLKY